MEHPPRPQRIDIWYNRKTSVQTYDRMRVGWNYLPSKCLDLTPEDNYSTLGAHRKPVSILHKVNITDEIPGRCRETRVRSEATAAPQELPPGEDYDIRGMWKFLQEAEPEMFKNRLTFDYPKETLAKNRAPVLFPDSARASKQPSAMHHSTMPDDDLADS